MELVEEDDEVCAVCHKEGVVLLCDYCNTTVHPECAGLKQAPDGIAVFSCDQCGNDGTCVRACIACLCAMCCHPPIPIPSSSTPPPKHEQSATPARPEAAPFVAATAGAATMATASTARPPSR